MDLTSDLDIGVLIVHFLGNSANQTEKEAQLDLVALEYVAADAANQNVTPLDQIVLLPEPLELGQALLGNLVPALEISLVQDFDIVYGEGEVYEGPLAHGRWDLLPPLD